MVAQSPAPQLKVAVCINGDLTIHKGNWHMSLHLPLPIETSFIGSTSGGSSSIVKRIIVSTSSRAVTVAGSITLRNWCLGAFAPPLLRLPPFHLFVGDNAWGGCG
jgi:hypothetical protein